MPFLPTVRTGVVATPAGPVTFHDSSSDGRTPIVLVHGTGGSAESHFWALFPMLAERHRVVALDLDFGPAGPRDMAGGEDALDAVVDQVRAVVEHVAAPGPVTVLGYSLGAVVAAAFAGRHADLVSDLVLVAGWMVTDRQQQLRNDVWWTLHETGSPALAEFSVLTAYSPAHLLARTPAEFAELIRRAGVGPDRTAAMRLNRHIDLTADVAAITARTLVIGCREDQMVPVHHSRLLFGGIEDARYAEIESGHAVVFERPAELFRLVSQFIEEPGRTAPGDILVQESM